MLRRYFDVRPRTKNLGPMGTPEGGGGAEAVISTAAGSIAGQLHGMVASMDKFQTAHMEVRRAEVAARELEVKSGLSKSILLCFIDPRVRKISNEAPSCPGILSMWCLGSGFRILL